MVQHPGSHGHLLFFDVQQSHDTGILQEAGQGKHMFHISESMATASKAHHCLFGSLNYPLLRQSVPRIHGISELAAAVYFCHLSPVKLTSATNTDSFWDLPVNPEIQMGSSLMCQNGMCTSV